MSIKPLRAVLIVARHGETDWNTQSRIQGHLDTPLSDKGLEQAHALAQRLCSESLAAVYASDLARASRTAQAVSVACGLELRLDPRLRERRFGLFEGATYAEAQVNWPDEWALWAQRQPWHAVPGGESTLQVRDRVVSCLSEIVVRHAGQRVLVVSHGGVIDILYRLAQGVAWEAPREHKIPNAAVNVLSAQWHPEGSDDANRLTLAVQVWADQAHLAQARDELR